jgi:hypothetical protein
LIINGLSERVGFEFTRKRSFNNIERMAGTVKQWKAVISSANGSQMDHGLSDHLKDANEGGRTLMFHRALPRGKSNLYGMRRSQRRNFGVADATAGPFLKQRNYRGEGIVYENGTPLMFAVAVTVVNSFHDAFRT